MTHCDRDRRALDALRMDLQQRGEGPHCFECFAPTVVRWDSARGYATTACTPNEGCRSWPSTSPGPFVLVQWITREELERLSEPGPSNFKLHRNRPGLADEVDTLCEVCRQPVELDDAEEIEGMPGRGTVWVHDECCEPRWRVHGMATGLPVNR